MNKTYVTKKRYRKKIERKMDENRKKKGVPKKVKKC